MLLDSKNSLPNVEGLAAFLDALKNLIGATPVGVTHTANPPGSQQSGQVRMLLRVPKVNGVLWLRVLKRMCILSTKASWTLDPSKLYFLTDTEVVSLDDEESTEMVYTWRLIVKSEDLPGALDALKKATRVPKPAARKTPTVARRPVQLMEVPLVGATASRNNYGRGKGASATSGSKESTPAMEYFRR